MTSIAGSFSGVENDYRRETIARSFREHRRTGRHLFPRRRRREPEPAIDWYGG